MFKTLMLFAGLCVAFCGCKKEEANGPDKTYYYGCNPAGGFAVNWHLTEYAVNDTSVRIAINDTVRFYTNQQYSWNDSLNKPYATCMTPATGLYNLTLSGSSYGYLVCNSFYSIAAAPDVDPEALRFSNSAAGANYYFWGHRFP